MIDKSVVPLGDARLDCGVNPRLIHNLRHGLDTLADQLDLPNAWQERARQYFRQVQIVATGGFNPKRIAQFEALGVPVDIYGVGSVSLRGRKQRLYG